MAMAAASRGLSSSTARRTWLLRVAGGLRLIQDRLDAVRRWLEDGNMDIATAAAQAGFSGSDHLIRAFSRRFGVTPAAYRHIHRRQALEAHAAAE
jgi:AraC-like DNA-binding protein